ncbi:MAG: hypothetical protein O2796_03645 [Bacteroidetes bacterium]|nr:hypothetical protein [Bacteroidota bacterium]MDA0879474.1 hypothetical protein [Bacteroidota bacterium]MDA1115457.1 hypothetical protein [Bacteroidota bacterium]
MKNKILTKSFILMMSLTAVMSCSKKDDDPTTGGDGGGGSAVKSITLTASALEGNVGDVVTFKVTTDTGEDVTATSAISVSGTATSNASFTIPSPCNFSAVAAYNGLTSNTLSLTGNTTSPVARFKKMCSSKILRAVGADTVLEFHMLQNRLNNSPRRLSMLAHIGMIKCQVRLPQICTV